jgi:hypothetical protein
VTHLFFDLGVPADDIDGDSVDILSSLSGIEAAENLLAQSIRVDLQIRRSRKQIEHEILHPDSIFSVFDLFCQSWNVV